MGHEPIRLFQFLAENWASMSNWRKASSASGAETSSSIFPRAEGPLEVVRLLAYESIDGLLAAGCRSILFENGFLITSLRYGEGQQYAFRCRSTHCAGSEPGICFPAAQRFIERCSKPSPN